MTKNIKNHLVTVIVPTRERRDTLMHTLHTCVAQDYDNLEVIVSDNFSQDQTREIVESYHDRRIHYVNTGKRVSMSDNFEYALSQIQPEGYVICLGDDDGLLPNAIRDINAVIIQTDRKVISWDIPLYVWPYNDRGNHLRIPSLKTGFELIDATVTINRVISFKDIYSYGGLPMLYVRSAVEYGIIKQIKKASDRFYHSMTPDIYSGFVIASRIDHLINSKKPYTIAGLSHHSTGASTLGNSRSFDAAGKYLSEDNLPCHPQMVFCLSLAAIVAECFLQAQDHVGFANPHKLNIDNLLARMMEEAAARKEDIYLSIKDAVLRLGQTHDANDAAQRAIQDYPRRMNGAPARRRTMRRMMRLPMELAQNLIWDLRRQDINVDCSQFGVTNIYEASRLCGHILKIHEMNVLGSTGRVKSAIENLLKILLQKR